MASKIYDSAHIYTVDNKEIYITPLKIIYLREFMDAFEYVKEAASDSEAISKIVECVRIAMKQYEPSINTQELIEDNFDLPTIYKVLDIAAGIKMDAKNEDTPVSNQASESGATWEKLDLARLESEAFLLGIWKDFEELESCMSMPELVAILETQRENDYNEKKFFAAIQGVDLDKQVGKGSGQDAWERMKAKVFSGGKAKDPNDITALQGINAQRAGFGIGMGLSYTDLTKK
jgi:hypothetical protein